MNLVGLGDLHLEGGLSKFIPDIDDLILRDASSILNKEARRGARHCLLYGDVFNKHTPSFAAYVRFLDFLRAHPEYTFLVIRGNHDTRVTHGVADTSEARCSLDLLRAVGLPNVIVALDPENPVLVEDGHPPINLMPWPCKTVDRAALNVHHLESKGATMDNGRPCDDGLFTRALCVAGHLHHAQSVRNTHYAGTLYQTSFGEDAAKAYHRILWTGDPSTSRIKLVPHSASVRLHNVVLRTKDDLATFLAEHTSASTDSVRHLYKVFASADLQVSDSTFEGLSGVVRTSGFSSSRDLRNQIQGAMEITSISEGEPLDVKASFHAWLDTNRVDAALRARALKKLDGYLSVKS